LHWVRSFVAFNPHATVSYQAKDEGSNVAEIYKSTLEGIKKYVPSEPTSPHWYSAASLKGLVFNAWCELRSPSQQVSES
jgi:hypothetical protein